VIKLPSTGNEGAVVQATFVLGHGVPEAAAEEPCAPAETRIAGLVRSHYDRIWRFVRRLGVRQEDADDAVQQVFLVVSRKIQAIRPESERAFLYQTALRVAATQRRSRCRRREAAASDPAAGWEFVDTSPVADELVELRRARAQLDTVLESMPPDLRAVFVLFELEEETMAEIAAMLNIPPETVASRLRRARRLFYACVTEDVLLGGGAL
jgi:RNA polymerase sigma-70 factor, ECF subfamily